MLHKVLASLLALFTIAFCPAAFAGSYGEVQLAPSYKTTYIASSAFFAPAASATDVFQLYGSASKTIRVLKISAANVASGSSTPSKYYVIKRSTANSGGTATTLTNVPVDSANAAATAVAKNYTANPTPGSTVGQVSSFVLSQPDSAAVSNATYSPVAAFDADKYGQAIVLRGTGEGVVVNMNGVSIGAGGTISFTVVWTEE